VIESFETEGPHLNRLITWVFKQLFNEKVDWGLCDVSEAKATNDGWSKFKIWVMCVFEDLNKDFFASRAHMDHCLADGIFIDATIFEDTH
jgi:hypothetical protein